MNRQSPLKTSDAGSSYFGGKGGSGVYQTLINQIPPHDFLVVPFAGHCAVTRFMKSPEKTIICDRDPDVISWWKERRANANRTFGKYPYILPRLRCGLSLLDDLLHDLALLRAPNPFGRVFIYCDPPYPAETLKSETRYQYDLADADHDSLLQLLSRLNSLPVDRRPHMMISSYWSKRYSSILAKWRHFTFQAQTRRCPATEHVWCNYPVPMQLQDYSHLGRNKRERFKLERRRVNLLEKLQRLPEIERNALLAAVDSEFGAVRSHVQ